MTATLSLYVWITVGSALGGLARYVASGAVAHVIGETLPWGTLVVNVVGSFLLAFLVFHDLAKGDLGPGVVAFVGIGALGAFTTMSAVGVETITYWADGFVARGVTTAALNLVGSLLAAALGRYVALLVSGTGAGTP